jgi:hypothetical protein
MAKGQQRPNRETKKTKKNKKAAAPPAFNLKTPAPMPGDKKK